MDNKKETKEKDVELNNNKKNKPNKKNNSKITILVVVIIILVLVLAVIIGVGISKKQNNNDNSVNTSENSEKEEIKTGKKLDENKPWVYDADYGKDNEEKKLKPLYSNEIYSSIDMIRIPYININSKDAIALNNELKDLYNELYTTFGKNGETVRGASYKVYNRNNILSILLEIDSGVLNGGMNRDYKTYNFNLETLNKADLFEVAQIEGFKNKEDLNKAINNSLLKAKKDLKVSENATRNDDIYYINSNGELYTMVLSMSEMGYTDLKIDSSLINMDDEELKNDTKVSEKNEEKSSTIPEYVNEYKKIIEKVQKENSNKEITYDLIYFNDDNIPDLVVGLQGYWVSLYMYKNGSVTEIVDEWSYGAMGNAGYDYLEKKGIIRNYNSDYAGAVMTQNILVLNNNNKFDTLSVTDQGADVPESDSSYQEIMKYLEKVKGYYFNDKKITEEEYNNKLKELSISRNESSYKVLFGTKTSTEIQKELQ